MIHAPLNIFQKLMRKWDTRHPYSAAQAMKIAGTADCTAVQNAWITTLTSAKIGRVRLHGDQYQFEPPADSRCCPVATVSQPLDEYISQVINRPFSDYPLRPFVLQQPDHFFLGTVYQHWIADSFAIRMLLRDWFARLYDPPAVRTTPFQLPAAGYWRSVGPDRSGWHVPESLLAMARRHTRLRRVQKVSGEALSDHHTRFQLFATPNGLLKQLRTAAAHRAVKLNDVFLAALAETCANQVPLQRRKNRTDVAVGSVVDLRPFCPDDLSQTFGLYLGFSNVVAHQQDLQNFELLLRIIANQTSLQKKSGVAPASLMWMGGAWIVGKLSKPDELYRFYRKELPLAGGLSNVDLNRDWPAKYHPHLLLDYIRISPTGPLGPLALTTTTLGEQLNVGLTHRTGLISPQRAKAIADTFIARLSNFH